MESEILKIKPIAKDVLPNRVSEAIMDLAARNHLQPGDRLPSERMLAMEFGIGRNSVRDGLLVLEKKGLIIRQVGKGAFLQQSISTDKVSLNLKKVNYRDLLEIKVHLDELAIEKAFENGTEEQFSQLKQIALDMLELAKQGKFSFAIDRSFHSLVYDCAGSDTLKQLILNLVDALDYYQTTWENPEECWLQTIPFHLDIVEALLAGDRAAAHAANTYIYKYDMKLII